jgi:hypothetical protein
VNGVRQVNDQLQSPPKKQPAQHQPPTPSPPIAKPESSL